MAQTLWIEAGIITLALAALAWIVSQVAKRVLERRMLKRRLLAVTAQPLPKRLPVDDRLVWLAASPHAPKAAGLKSQARRVK